MKKIISFFSCLMACAFIFIASNTEAAHWEIRRIICLEDIFFLEAERLPIPVGCEVIDCCPGCPGPGPIDWRIQIKADLFDSVKLEFSNLPSEVSRRLGLKGDIKRIDANTFVVAGKDSFISGFQGITRGRPAVAMPRFGLNKAKVRKIMSGAQDLDEKEISVTIMQMLGPVVVNRFEILYKMRLCRELELLPVQDQVDLDDNTANDRAIVMLTGRRSTGCIDNNREFQNTTDKRTIGNMLSNGTCTTESVVFSDDNAIEIDSPTMVWTDNPGNTLKMNLDPMVSMPVNIVLARAGANAAATNDLANADLLYNDNNAGITFNGTIQDVSGNANDVNTITRNARCSAANLADLQGSAFYNGNALNVYYVNGAFTAANCVNDRLVVFVGNNANAASLAHEFGHSFSLFGTTATGGHTNGLPGFGTDNIMNGGGPATRDHFSVGQVFRFNINITSSLNTTGARTDLTRNCPALTVNINCPPLELDSLPH